MTAALSDADADFIRAFVRERAAIVLDASKGYLIETRLAPLAKVRGAAGVGDLVAQLRVAPCVGDLDADVVDALTTNETSWFRDRHPFEVLRSDILPPLLEARTGRRQLVVWSAACSSGQEAYSIAMVLRTHFPALARWRVRIVGFDLSRAMVARAQAATYSQLEVNRGLPAEMLARHLERDGTRFRVVPELRAMCDFHERNLVGTSLAGLPTPDVVFLRNVLIYFDHATKRAIVDAVAERLAPDGALLLGAAESTFGISDRFERVCTGPFSWYRLPAGPS